jgi:hypothetical protein
MTIVVTTSAHALQFMTDLRVGMIGYAKATISEAMEELAEATQMGNRVVVLFNVGEDSLVEGIPFVIETDAEKISDVRQVFIRPQSLADVWMILE